MLTRRGWIGWTMAGLISAGLPAAAADEKERDGGDLKKLEGKWAGESGQGGDKIIYTFKGKTLKVEAPTRTYEMTVTLDASESVPEGGPDS